MLKAFLQSSNHLEFSLLAIPENLKLTRMIGRVPIFSFSESLLKCAKKFELMTLFYIYVISTLRLKYFYAPDHKLPAFVCEIRAAYGIIKYKCF